MPHILHYLKVRNSIYLIKINGDLTILLDLIEIMACNFKYAIQYKEQCDIIFK